MIWIADLLPDKAAAAVEAMIDESRATECPLFPPLEADIRQLPWQVRFSNRPFGVKRFQTIHRCSVDVARGLVLL